MVTRLDGTKQFITSARTAAVTIVFAVTDPRCRQARDFCLCRAARDAGVSASRGSRTSSASNPRKTGQMQFPPTVLIGVGLASGRRRAMAIALRSPISSAGRIGIAAQSVGMARARRSNAAIAYAKERKSFRRGAV